MLFAMPLWFLVVQVVGVVGALGSTWFRFTHRHPSTRRISASVSTIQAPAFTTRSQRGGTVRTLQPAVQARPILVEFLLRVWHPTCDLANFARWIATILAVVFAFMPTVPRNGLPRSVLHSSVCQALGASRMGAVQALPDVCAPLPEQKLPRPRMPELGEMSVFQAALTSKLLLGS